MALTPKQQIIYDFICDFYDTNGYSPSVREICEGVGLKSTATVHAHIENLKNLGVLDKASMKNRALVINSKTEEAPPESANEEIAHIPVLGKVAAGQPIYAIHKKN